MKNSLYIIALAGICGVWASCGESEGCGCADFGLWAESEQQTVFFPGAFTPNGDGLNDHAMLQYSGAEPASVKILVQYDNTVIDSSFGVHASWDGHTEGLNVPDRAEFRIYLYYTDASGNNITKTFRLMRIIPSSCGISRDDRELPFGDTYIPGTAEPVQTNETVCP